MAKKRKGQWQADIFNGFNDGWAVAIDPIGVLIQAIGMMRKVDWKTIGGSSFFKKGSIATWIGKFILPAFMVWFVYTAWPTHWHWIVGFITTATLLNIIGIWWRTRHPEFEYEIDSGPDPDSLESGLSEPVTTEPPPDPKTIEPLITKALMDGQYKMEAKHYASGEACNHNYLSHFEEGLNIDKEYADTFRRQVAAAFEQRPPVEKPTESS